MDAIKFGFMTDYLTNKSQEIAQKNKVAGIPSMPAFMQNGFAFGGDLQTNGADFPTKLTHINAGGSHEANPNDGIQLGVDPEGTPNLVEENETVFNNYVYSNRIFADGGTLQKFHLPKKAKLTFAEISKKLEKEIKERPNDPISEAGFKAQMEQLADEQERQKQEMEAARAGEAFKTLSPEEQTAVMQSAAQQEAMAEQAAQRQVEAEQQAAMQQPSPEEIAIMQQQMSPEDQAAMEQQQLAQMQANVSALGGELVKARDVKDNKNIYAFAGQLSKKQNRKLSKRYSKEWFEQQAKALGIDDELMGKFEYKPDDAQGNLTAFNEIYRKAQYNKALDTYRTGQRKSKRNELFDSKTGRFRKSDDGSKIYEAQYRQEGQDWISPDRIISDEEYGKLSDKDKEAFKRIRTNIGDKLYDYNGKLMESLYDGDENSILDSYNYDDGFKWDDKDAQTLQYPVGMERSDLSYLRYVPALGGAIGLMNGAFSSPDYSNAAAVEKAGNVTPSLVQPHYIGNYLTYRPMDIWYQQNALNAQSRATDRALLNSASPSRAAGLLANSYNSQLASGNLYRQALEYNNAQKERVEAFNRGTNQFNAEMGFNADRANQAAIMDAQRLGFQGTLYGSRMRDDIDARRNASMNANLTNLLQSIGNIGEEAYDEDRLKWLEGTGVLRSDYFNRGKYGTSAAKGGKIKKKKKGLTV